VQDSRSVGGSRIAQESDDLGPRYGACSTPLCVLSTSALTLGQAADRAAATTPSRRIALLLTDGD
jgi:hypothetical protein